MFKRTLWAVLRKKKRTFLLWVLFSLTTSIILGGLMLKSGIEKAEGGLQSKAKATIQITQANTMIKQGDKVDDKLFEKIIQKKNVESYGTSLEDAVDTNQAALGQETDDEKMSMGGELENTTITIPTNSVFSLDDPKYNADFSSKTVSLSSGVFPKDENQVLVSDDFLERNNKSLGDTFEIIQRDMLNNNKEIRTTVSISGTYKIEQKQTDVAAVRSLDKRNNLYMTTQGVLALRKNYTNIKGSSTVTIPQISLTLSEGSTATSFIHSLEEDGGNYSNISFASSEDEASYFKESIAATKRVITIVLISAISFSSILLFFLMVFSLRERKTEIGILLSLGEKKSKILLQSIVETSMVLSLSLIFVIGVIGPLINLNASSYVNNELIQANQAAEQKKETIVPEILSNSSEQSKEDENSSKKEIEIGNYPKEEILYTLLIIFVVTTGATLLPICHLLRKKPKEILVHLD